MPVQNQINYWLQSAQHDFETAEGLFIIKKFDWCLFLGHLVLEKTLKAYLVKETQSIPSKSHNLLLLAENANLQLSSEQKIFLEKVNDFNIEARYPDEKFSFYKICTESFTQENLNKIKDFYQWLLTKMK